MRYSKPKCNCGNELLFSEVLTCNRPISNSGHVIGNSCLDAMKNIESTLCCPQCGRKYDVDTDKGNKIFRGSLLIK